VRSGKSADNVRTGHRNNDEEVKDRQPSPATFDVKTQNLGAVTALRETVLLAKRQKADNKKAATSSKAVSLPVAEKGEKNNSYDGIKQLRSNFPGISTPTLRGALTASKGNVEEAVEHLNNSSHHEVVSLPNDHPGTLFYRALHSSTHSNFLQLILSVWQIISTLDQPLLQRRKMLPHQR
jgi:hypothetical protein